jgi:hypothetical protein
MSTPASNQNEPSKKNKLMSGNVDESIRTKLPRDNGSMVQQPSVTYTTPPAASPDPVQKGPRFKFLPAFWTIASLMSITVNIILIVILLTMFQMFGAIQGTTTDQVSGLLGGLYTNFVKMDQAHIQTSIHVEKEIPVQFILNVSGPTNVRLSQPVTIGGALVSVSTGGLNIANARATIVLPQDTLLPINIENLVVPVDQKVLASLDVPVDIPLDQTELHEPFVGLQRVVQPWYCLVKRDATFNGVPICVPAAEPTLVNPTPFPPTPVTTVMP